MSELHFSLFHEVWATKILFNSVRSLKIEEYR